MSYGNPYQTGYQPTYPQSNGITWVQGVEGAKAYQLVPNSNAVMLDSENEGIFYIKVSDAVGMCKLRTFKFVEIQPTSQTTADMSAYLTKEEFYKVMEEWKNEQSVSKSKSKSTNTTVTE